MKSANSLAFVVTALLVAVVVAYMRSSEIAAPTLPRLAIAHLFDALLTYRADTQDIRRCITACGCANPHSSRQASARA